MSNRIKKTPNSRYSAEQIISLLDQFDRGGISLKAFCADKGISQATFFNWRKRYLNRKIGNGGDFIELIPTTTEAEVPDHANGLFAEVRGIRIYQPVSATYLKALIS
jgi:transposase-like protein